MSLQESHQQKSPHVLPGWRTSPGGEARLALHELRQTEDPWLENQRTSLQESMQAEDPRVEERDDFLFCGTGLRNADSSSVSNDV